MGKAKEIWAEENEQDPKNWRTVQCKHCGENYKINIVTKTNVNEFGYLPDCYKKIYLGNKD